jgi:hypothetical protein
MTDDNGQKPARRPSPAVLRALAEQNTRDVRKEAKRYAEKRVPLLRGAFIPVSRRTADELVDDAITDTWLGEGDPWDPSTCDLLTHLRGAIKKRTWQEIRHRMRVRTQPVDSADSEHEDALARDRGRPRSTAKPCASMGDVAPIMLAGLIETVCTELLRIDETDAHTRQILECWQCGFFERREVVFITEMSEEDFNRARRRILSRKKFLPARLVETVEDLLDRSA